ncbi:MAG TPA: molecular chaperone HtpG, partial [Bacillota bacterium]|nr:molecular chaperone HtpG [Bacillota bacterium]
YEILYFIDDVDEFAVRVMGRYRDKEFKSVSAGDLGLEAEEDQKAAENGDKEEEALFREMKELLAEKVSAVRASKRLKNHPVCLVNEGSISIEMEKILKNVPGNPGLEAEKVLEINTGHPVFPVLKEAFASDRERFKLYTDLLYNQARLIEGLPVEDPVEFSNNICRIMGAYN